MTKERIERDSMGDVAVPADHAWGAQTQRSLENFPIGRETMPPELLSAFALLKKAAAESNHELLPSRMTREKRDAIVSAADGILAGRYPEEFPLSVWQTGSGTQTNMNFNEVIAHVGNAACGRSLLHPNDDVNLSQSSNDTFPTAMRISAVRILSCEVIPALEDLIGRMRLLEEENRGIVKTGRTHLQDAVPIAFSQEISGWRGMLESCRGAILASIGPLSALPLGATAVGTGLNSPRGFGRAAAEKLSAATGLPFRESDNKFRSLTSLDDLVFAHGALKALAASLMKIANDLRWLASGPRCGLGEITLPANEPGSSIMPGKVNPTQCEAISMIAVQVMGNDAAVGFAASQGNFELNVFLPVTAYNFLQSARLLADGMRSFEKRALAGMKANPEKMEENLGKSLMTVTALSPRIGYEKAARVAGKAHREGLTLPEAAESLGYLTAEECRALLDPASMLSPGEAEMSAADAR